MSRPDKAHRAGEDAGEAVNGVQHRRLAGPVRADQAERTAAGDAERHAAQHVHASIAGMEIVDGEQRRCAGKPVERGGGHAARVFVLTALCLGPRHHAAPR